MAFRLQRLVYCPSRRFLGKPGRDQPLVALVSLSFTGEPKYTGADTPCERNSPFKIAEVAPSFGYLRLVNKVIEASLKEQRKKTAPSKYPRIDYPSLLSFQHWTLKNCNPTLYSRIKIFIFVFYLCLHGPSQSDIKKNDNFNKAILIAYMVTYSFKEIRLQE